MHRLWCMLINLGDTMFTTLMAAALAADVSFVPADPAEGLPAFIAFEGIVERGDARAVKALVEAHNCKLVLIASPGGSAFEGLELYDMAVEQELHTTAVGFGAWSAAAMFWLGGTTQTILPTSQVGFHFAYDGWTGQPAPQWWHATVGARVQDSVTRSKAFKDTTGVTDMTLSQWQEAYDRYGTAGFFVFQSDDQGKVTTAVIDSAAPTSSAPSQVREFMKSKRQTLETK